jgi:superfamily II DNA or RNA helicase
MIYTINCYLNNYGLCIKKNKINNNLLYYIKKNLTVTPQPGLINTEIEPYEIFYEDDKYIVLPKFTNKINIDGELIIDNKKITSLNFKINKYKYTHKKININFKGALRDYQHDIINYVMDLFNKSVDLPKGGIIKLTCGGGKTILAIAIACMLGLKTLVLVHKEFLLDQWKEKIEAFTNATVGIIRQKSFQTDFDIVIGMIHSISAINYDQNILNEFGLVILDEVHHLGSNMFSKTLLKTSAEYTIGLSATPERQDGMMKVVNSWIGNIIYQMKKKYDYRVFIKKIMFRTNDFLFKEKKRWINGEMRPNHTKMNENLSLINSRTNLIIKLIDSLRSLGRKILILSSRIDHLTKIKNGVDKLIKEADEEHIYNTYYYMGSTKKGERKMAEKDGDIIFATLQLAEEGLDIDRLDTILLALPIKQQKTVTQSIGRILRKDKLDDLTSIPLVIDISDLLSIYQKWSSKRNEIYSINNWFIQNFYFEDENYIYKDTDDKNKNFLNILFNDIDDEKFIEENLIIKENNLIIKENINSTTNLCIQNNDQVTNGYGFGRNKKIINNS